MKHPYLVCLTFVTDLTNFLVTKMLIEYTWWVLQHGTARAGYGGPTTKRGYLEVDGGACTGSLRLLSGVWARAEPVHHDANVQHLGRNRLNWAIFLQHRLKVLYSVCGDLRQTDSTKHSKGTPKAKQKEIPNAEKKFTPARDHRFSFPVIAAWPLCVVMSEKESFMGKKNLFHQCRWLLGLDVLNN